jgi:outer membrane protein assembly factor BamB
MTEPRRPHLWTRPSGRAARLRLIGSAVLAASVISASAISASAAQGDWSAYLLGPRHSSFNAAAATFTPSSASTLHPDWTFTPAAPTNPGQPQIGFAATPVVSDGVVYIGANTGVFYAVDETSGAVLWHRSLGYTVKQTCAARGVSSTATLAADPSRSGQLTVYVAGGDGYLYALRASDGAIVWRSFVVGIGTTQNTGYNWASPTLSGGHLYIGVSSECDDPLIRGGIKEFDAASGALLHTYWSVPKGSVGGSVWTTPASDGRRLWATIGNGNDGDSFAIVRLDASTMVRQDRWVVPGTAGTDLDWGSSPTSFRATLSGEPTPMVGGCSKNGRYYAFASGNLAAGPVWSRWLGVTGSEESGAGACLAAAIWDHSDRVLFVGSNKTNVAGASTPGSLRALDPATGKVIWARAIAGGPVMGSPTLSGGGVIAAGTYNAASPSSNAVYLVSAADGTIINTIHKRSAVFAQPVFSDSHLLVATSAGVLTAYSTGA